VTESKSTSVLVVDDDRSIRQFIRTSLTAHRYLVHEAGSGEEALESVRRLQPNVILLDLGLPDIDGVDLVRSLRRNTEVPIVIISVRDQQSDKAAAFAAGADEYVSKPFGTHELLRRIRGVMQRGYPTTSAIVVGELSVDFVQREVLVGSRLVDLTKTEFDLLTVLVAEAGRVVTDRRLALRVWNAPRFEDVAGLLQSSMATLRRKLEGFVLIEPGVGYRLRVSR
jgi:two-component system, OmpR family, KDP operon response regulator KdpE